MQVQVRYRNQQVTRKILLIGGLDMLLATNAHLCLRQGAGRATRPPKQLENKTNQYFPIEIGRFMVKYRHQLKGEK